MPRTIFALTVAASIFVSVFGSPSAESRHHHHHHRQSQRLIKKRHQQHATSSVAMKRNNSQPPDLRFAYGQEKVRGVNLGGWLVLEVRGVRGPPLEQKVLTRRSYQPFITPSLFSETGNEAIVDELTFCQYQDYNTAHKKLVDHWDTWITQDDLVAIKAAGSVVSSFDERRLAETMTG